MKIARGKREVKIHSTRNAKLWEKLKSWINELVKEKISFIIILKGFRVELVSKESTLLGWNQ